jgi:tRNA threonylcarbamoyl adenosine modification protein (Sua5/YciO/YrdC/YwlC family)
MGDANTEVIKVDSQVGAADAARRASDVLTRGGLVVIPTETVYGVAARADDPEAISRLRRLKSRKRGQAFTVHLGSRDDATRFVPQLAGLAGRFIRKAWPGPLTLIVEAPAPPSDAPPEVWHKNTVGLRCPDDPIAGPALRGVDALVVAASANPAGEPAPCTADEILPRWDGKIDLLIDAGRTRYAKASTIVRVKGSTYKIVREGVLDEGIVRRLATLRLLFVCTGNTCRTPMAAAMARSMLAQRLECSADELPDRGIEVWSAGTAGGYGVASEQAVAVMARRGIDLSDHQSQALTPEMIHQADFVFAMTESHRRAVLDMNPTAEESVRLLLDGEDVFDPIGGSEEDYERCAATIERGLQARLQEMHP